MNGQEVVDFNGAGSSQSTPIRLKKLLNRLER